MATACQGRTMHQGVIIDCRRSEGGAHATLDDDYWLHLYVMRASQVMLSSATPPQRYHFVSWRTPLIRALT